MNRRFPSEGDCKRVKPRLERVVSHVIDYARRKRYFDPLFAEFQKRIPDPSKYPLEWSEMVVAMLYIGTVTMHPRRSQGFVRSVRDELVEPELALVRQWRKVPWVYVLFEAFEPVEHDIFLVRPVGEPPRGWPDDVSWEELPVYSPTLARAYGEGVSSGVALLLYDGTVFHTYGVVLHFKSVSVQDVLFFAAVLADDSAADEVPYLLGDPDDVPSISTFIGDDPLPFLMLIQLQELPVMAGRRGPWRYCVSMADYDGSEDLSDEAVWRRVVAESTDGTEGIQGFAAVNGVVGMRLGSDGPMYEPVILVSSEDGVVFVRAMNEAAYRQGVEAIRSLVAMPEAPQVTASMVMLQSVEEILGMADVVSELNEVVADELDGEPVEAGGPDSSGAGSGGPADDGVIPLEFEEVQPILNLLIEGFNEGVDYTDRDIAVRTGVEEEHVAALRRQVEKMVGEREQGSGRSPAAADRFGLPPGPFHRLFSRKIPAVPGVIALRDLRGVELTDSERAAIREAPIVRFAQWILEQGKIPATAAGYVAPKVVRQAVDAGVVPAHDEAPVKELDAPVFHRYREILEAAECIQLDGRWFVPGHTVPAAGTPLDVGTLTGIIAEAMFTTVRWDESRYFGAVPGLRESAGFLLYVLRTLAGKAPDGWVKVRALYDAFLGANPRLKDSILVSLSISVNFIDYFAAPLGLVEVGTANGENVRVRPTPVFRVLFE